MAALLKAAQGVAGGRACLLPLILRHDPVIVVAGLALRGQLREGVRPKRSGRHLGRGVVGTLAMMSGFLGLTRAAAAGIDDAQLHVAADRRVLRRIPAQKWCGSIAGAR